MQSGQPLDHHVMLQLEVTWTAALPIYVFLSSGRLQAAGGLAPAEHKR